MKSPGRIAVVGMGYVGLPLALLASDKGFYTYGIESNKERLELLKQGSSQIGDDKLKKAVANSKLNVTDDFSVVSQTSIVIICVPTPIYDNFHPNLEFVKAATISVARNIKKGTLIILESTVNPGVSDTIIAPIVEEESGLKLNEDFYIAHCPERIDQGKSQWSEGWSLININRVVGASNQIGLDKAISFYKKIIDAIYGLWKLLKKPKQLKLLRTHFGTSTLPSSTSWLNPLTELVST